MQHAYQREPRLTQPDRTSVGRQVSSASLKDQVLAGLRAGLLTGDFSPGTIYKMGEVGEMFGASRTPVREAVLELESRGVVEIIRSVGFRVVEPTAEDMKNMWQVRAIVEVPAMESLVGRLSDSTLAELWSLIDAVDDAAQSNDLAAYLTRDAQLHDTLYEHLPNRHLATIIRDLRDSQRVPSLGGRRAASDLVARNEEHRALVTAIAAGDTEKIQTLTENHLLVNYHKWQDGTQTSS